jgi:hypothetical protein
MSKLLLHVPLSLRRYKACSPNCKFREFNLLVTNLIVTDTGPLLTSVMNLFHAKKEIPRLETAAVFAGKVFGV